MAFSAAALGLVSAAHRHPEDLDEIRSKICTLITELFCTLRYSPLTRVYRPNLHVRLYEETPEQRIERTSTYLESIVSALADTTGPAGITKLTSTMEILDHLLENLICMGRFEGLADLLCLSYEYLHHWSNLRLKREEIVHEHPHLKYHINTRSVFPLTFNLEQKPRGRLAKLLYNLNIKPTPLQRFTVLELSKMLQDKMQEKLQAGELKINLETYLSRALDVPFNRIDLSNLATFIPVVATRLPTLHYLESWRAANPNLNLPFLFQQNGILTPLNVSDLEKDVTSPLTTKPDVDTRKPDEPVNFRSNNPAWDSDKRSARRKLRYSPHKQTPKNVEPENVSASGKRCITPPFLGLPGCSYSPITPATEKIVRPVPVFSTNAILANASSNVSLNAEKSESPFSSISELPEPPSSPYGQEIFYSDSEFCCSACETPYSTPSPIATPSKVTPSLERLSSLAVGSILDTLAVSPENSTPAALI